MMGRPYPRLRIKRPLAILPLAILALAATYVAVTPRNGVITVRECAWLQGAALHADLREALESAQTRILVVMFLVSSSDIEDHPVYQLIGLLKDAHARGVDVMVVMDERFRAKNSLAYDQLAAAGITVRYDNSAALTHTKLVVADSDVFIGSANWSALALSGGNIEATVRLRDAALADSCYAQRLKFFTGAERTSLTLASSSLLAEARLAFRSPQAGELRRSLTAAGLDADALADAGAGWMPPGDTVFRQNVLAGIGLKDGWIRWNLPPVTLMENRLIFPGEGDHPLIIDASEWRVLSGRFVSREGMLGEVAKRCGL